MGPDFTPVGGSDLGTDCPSSALFPNNDRPGEEDMPFLPRFLLQGIILRIVGSLVSLFLSLNQPAFKEI